MASSSNKRIAKNTAYLYMRMLLVMMVALYTSRVVLEALGVDDYGTYNVVGGLSASFMFFSSSLSNSTQRFLNIELGKRNLTQVNRIFSVCFLLFSLLAIIVIILSFTFGKWFVVDILNIPEVARNAAVIVLYATALTLAVTLICSTYESVVVARENMKIYAFLGVVDAIAKLAIAYLIMLVPDKLIWYAWLMLFATILPKAIIVLYSIRKYPESRPKLIWDNSLVKEMFIFNGWNIYGSAIWVANMQGLNIILNVFFGPAVNAARGIANQVNNAVTNFTSNFFVAVRPQIVKRYATEEFDSLISLIFNSSKYSFFLLWIICLPLLFNMNEIINLWLKNPPFYATAFTNWTLIYSLLSVLHHPMWSAVAAIGHLKKFILLGSNVLLLCLPISYLFLYYNISPIVIYPIIIIFQSLYQFITIILIQKYLPISLKDYFSRVLTPIIKVVTISIMITLSIHLFVPENLIGFIISLIISIIVAILTAFYVGMDAKNRIIVLVKMKQLLHL